MTQSVRPTFVYIMNCGRRTKIGISADPQSRRKHIEGSSGEAVFIRWTKEFTTRSSARVAERSLHRRFATHRLRGEWFNIRPEVAIAAAEQCEDCDLQNATIWHADLPRDLIGDDKFVARFRWYEARGLPYPEPYM